MEKSLPTETTYSEWRHRQRGGLKAMQEDLVQFFHDTRLFRIYSSTLVPGLVQTEGYAAALLSGIAEFHGIPNDGPEAAAARVRRSQVIHQPGHEVILLVEEGVLRHQIGDTRAMAGQLEYLLTAGALPALSLGVIPFSTQARPMSPSETFHVYDDTLVSVELVAAKVKIAQPAEIALYLRTFQQLQQLAVYGAEARALIHKAIEALD
ncbi:DUF5753 domain-containing protein [Streptomyces sp. WMMC500]|uniref:DUF5753 domain-containing protein n=1 Tax=Streptomyces sp. WMMC500 TaxID=3015154 RepID=UPI00248AA90D|nr:DUF5753 domain-containing protein [Streptomyces sp. WMMC500]WBB63619.1 DUF5753 domain-containing protein [Streptomyces sp. WMMC500]